MIRQVIHFNQAILKIDRLKPALLSQPEAEWLRNALIEEVMEFKQAHEGQDLVGSVDSLLDLIYFSIGGLYRLGLNEKQIENTFNAVHSANLRKKVGIKASRPQDGSVPDAIKPVEFVSPEEEISRVLYGKA